MYLYNNACAHKCVRACACVCVRVRVRVRACVCACLLCYSFRYKKTRECCTFYLHDKMISKRTT